MIVYQVASDNLTIDEMHIVSDMIFQVHSNAVYLVKPNTKTRVGEYFFLSEFIEDISKVEPTFSVRVDSHPKVRKHHKIYKIQ